MIVETVALLSKLSEAKHHVEVKVDMDELDSTSVEAKAIYREIEEWVREKYGFHVTNLNISQVKQKRGCSIASSLFFLFKEKLDQKSIWTLSNPNEGCMRRSNDIKCVLYENHKEVRGLR